MSNPIVLCTACNETYALGGMVAVASALRLIPADAGEVKVYVLDGGMRDRSWAKLARSLELTKRKHQLIRLRPEMQQFEGLPQDWGSSVMTYARLALPKLVDEQRLVYIDADMVVQEDISPLARLDLGGQIVGASQDVIVQTLGNENLPVTELGLSPDAPYLQAGLLVIDLPAWRDERVSERVLEYLKAWPDNAKHWDQSALNVVLYQRWHQLPSTWNVPGFWASQGIGEIGLEAAVLHFVGPHKPWMLGHSENGAALRFFEVVDRSAWKGWRPTSWKFALKMIKYRAYEMLKGRKPAKA